MNAAAWTCLLLPLAAATAITLAGGRLSRRQAGYLSTATTMGAFVAAVIGFAVMLGEHPEERAHYSTAWTWLSAGQYDFGLTILTDQLSMMMMLIVAGVGSLIIAYSVGYMDGEDEERRFFAYMSLFVFSMLLLVQSGNLLLLLAGWGMVGLSSYLLIGFYQQKQSAIAAAKKAFIINAGGDAAMAIALFLLIQQTGVLQFDEVFAAAPTGGTAATVIALGLLGGAVAKSAQVPLHTWLPDAMEGPTPVSALIHAATMVVAGVYLLVRTGPLFVNAQQIADLAAVLGAVTLLMAGLIALVQTDIKRVIAYSTMSQIGYMFVGAATGAYPQAMFHLMTHAFFKALLFLAAGIIIHALTNEQDIRRMGGLGRALPYTKWVFLAGSLALVGIPPFSGFFSKDEIIAAQLDLGGELGYFLFACCIAGAFLTGLYTFRLYFIVFGGEKSQFAQEHLHEPHGRLEGPVSMIWPVGILAVLATFAGWIQFAPYWEPITHWLDPVAAPLLEASGTQELIASVCAVGLGAAGIAVAWLLYVRKWRPVPKPWAILEEKFLFDELYDAVLYRPAVALSLGLQRVVEQPLIAGSITEITKGFKLGSLGLGRVQNGLVRSYALVLTSGIAVLAVVFIASR
jgi:NADH-quinone oxidoreductase subunit L